MKPFLYRIRNGKGYAVGKEEYTKEQKNEAKRVLGIVMESIIKDVSANVKGKRIYIPAHMKYALPSTGKQFTGDLPSGTCVIVPKDIVFGIHWENVGGHMIDLDLSTISLKVGKIGWDSSYRTQDRDIMFSGDVTSAPLPRGASELFYVRRQITDAHIMLVNYYNYDSKVTVPFKILVAKEQVSNFRNNYMVNPNNVMAIAKTKINQKQKILGLLVTTTKECRFYFTETYLGRSISSSGNKYVENSRKYLYNYYTNTICLNDVLEKAGAKLVNDKDKCDVDLSPETLEKDKIIKLVK